MTQPTPAPREPQDHDGSWHSPYIATTHIGPYSLR